METITKDAVLDWKNIEGIRDLDLNIIEDYMTDGFVFVKYNITPIAYILLCKYFNNGIFKVINNDIEFELIEYNLANGYEELSLLCKDMEGKVFNFKYNDTMTIKLNCTNVDLKVAILKFKAMYEMCDFDNPDLAKLLSIQE